MMMEQYTPDTGYGGSGITGGRGDDVASQDTFDTAGMINYNYPSLAQ